MYVVLAMDISFSPFCAKKPDIMSKFFFSGMVSRTILPILLVITKGSWA